MQRSKKWREVQRKEWIIPEVELKTKKRETGWCHRQSLRQEGGRETCHSFASVNKKKKKSFILQRVNFRFLVILKTSTFQLK